jgi:hypothetical protein
LQIFISARPGGRGSQKGANFMKGGDRMKKLVSLLMMGVLALSLAACAATGGKDKVRVKCPACGYEFDAPSQP